MWGLTPVPGDWVTANSEVKTSLSDYLLGGGISEGTRGVVIERRGGRALVEFGSGLSATRAHVPFRDLRLVRRGGGIDQYRTRERRMGIVRVALVGFLVFPIFQFVAVYLWHNRSFDGIVPAFAEAALWSVGDWIGMALQNPVQTLLYCGFLCALAKIAFHH